ncbi:hypothetical protein J437_LFUL017801, partial [Ladona fulva]
MSSNRKEKVVLIHVGTNDVKTAESEDHVIGYVWDLCSVAKEKFAEANIAVCGILRRNDVSDVCINYINNGIEWACKAKGLTFVDPNCWLNINDLGRDGIHLNRRGNIKLVDLITGNYLLQGFLAAGELDPLNRRLCSEKKPDVVVQVVILAEDTDVRDKLLQHDFHVQTIAEVAPIEVQPARRNDKLGLTGRKSKDVGILSTSKLYSLQDRIFAFTPQLTDLQRFYIASDYELMIDIFKSEINFLKSSWQNMLGRPLVVMTVKSIHLDNGNIPNAMITTMKKLKSGYINGT